MERNRSASSTDDDLLPAKNMNDSSPSPKLPIRRSSSSSVEGRIRHRRSSSRDNNHHRRHRTSSNEIQSSSGRKPRSPSPRKPRSPSPREYSSRRTRRSRSRKRKTHSKSRSRSGSRSRRKERSPKRSKSPRRKNRSSISRSRSGSQSRKNTKPRRSRFTDKPTTEQSITVGAMAFPASAPLNVSAQPQSSLFFPNGSNPYAPPSFTSNLMPVLNLPMTLPTPAYPKEAKELFIGNTPPGTTDAVLLEFLNAALKQVGLATGPLDPITNCRMSSKFAFIECRTVEDTNAVLNITGIPFMGSMLKIGRPTKYPGPPGLPPPTTWQQLTGQSTETPLVDPSTKIFRGNTSPEMTEIGLREFLGGAMHKMGLTVSIDNPIVQVRLNGRFSFVEVRSVEEAANTLNLNGIPFMGQPLKISRPTKYEGPQIKFYDWDDLLARYMTGDLKLSTAGPPQKAIKLTNMVSATDLADASLRDEVLEDTRAECAQFGTVVRVLVPRKEDGPYAANGVSRVYVQMSTVEEAKAALLALKGRTFDGRIVDVKFFPENQLEVNPPDFTDPKPLIVTAAGLVTKEVIMGSGPGGGGGGSSIYGAGSALHSSISGNPYQSSQMTGVGLGLGLGSGGDFILNSYQHQLGTTTAPFPPPPPPPPPPLPPGVPNTAAMYNYGLTLAPHQYASLIQQQQSQQSQQQVGTGSNVSQPFNTLFEQHQFPMNR